MRTGRPRTLDLEVENLIIAWRAQGRGLRAIARELNATRTPTAHGGERWHPATVKRIIESRTTTTATH
jgi:Recombinase